MRADLLLNHYNLFDMFDKKYYKEDYTNNNKYQYILNDLNINLNDVVIFEDNQKEIDKAINLGISSDNIINATIKGEKSYE